MAVNNGLLRSVKNTSPPSSPYLLPHLALVHETLQFVGQVAVFVAQLVVSGAVLLDLGLDFCQHHLEVAGHLLPLLLILPAALNGLLLEGWMNGKRKAVQ